MNFLVMNTISKKRVLWDIAGAKIDFFLYIDIMFVQFQHSKGNLFFKP